MGVVIIASTIGVLASLAALAAVLRLNRRPVPTWGGRRTGQPRPHVGAACHCGHGQLRFMWRYGFGQILRCSNYPVCRAAYQFNGQPLPAAQQKVLLQVR